SPVVSFTGYRDLSAEFEDCSDNNINEVNVAGTRVLTVGQISPNSTNTFSAAGPSNAATSPTHGKSSFIDASQLSDDPDMPELEDITYFDDEDDVGAEANFNHPVTQIIGRTSSIQDAEGLDLSLFSVWKKSYWNKAILIAQGHTQEEGIDYEEIFAPVARIE
nr:hypothetical protein [Tanacetum cinerariifolium]